MADDINLTQVTYCPTQYEESTWELIGKPPSEAIFIPSNFEIISNKNNSEDDPMFADFGGKTHDNSAKQYWQLAEGLEHTLYQGHQESEKKDDVNNVGISEDELNALKEAAYQEGYNAAVAELNPQFQQQGQEYGKKLEEILLDIQKQIEENLTEVEKQAIDLSLSLAKKIIDGAVEINPEYIVDIINKAISLAGTAEVKNIHISPQDYEFINVVGVGREIKGFSDAWQFTADPLVKAGCIVETTAGEIDYQIEPAWQRIKEQVLKIKK